VAGSKFFEDFPAAQGWSSLDIVLQTSTNNGKNAAVHMAAWKGCLENLQYLAEELVLRRRDCGGILLREDTQLFCAVAVVSRCCRVSLGTRRHQRQTPRVRLLFRLRHRAFLNLSWPRYNRRSMNKLHNVGSITDPRTRTNWNTAIWIRSLSSERFARRTM